MLLKLKENLKYWYNGTYQSEFESKEYNRVRSLMARAKESPTERERRLEKSRESARRRRTMRKAQIEKEMRKLGLLPLKQNIVDIRPGPLNQPNPSNNLRPGIKNGGIIQARPVPVKINKDYDDMATVCPIECNVDFAPEPAQSFKNTLNQPRRDQAIVKNLGTHVVLKKKIVNRGPTEDVRIPNGGGGGCDWNGMASVCPIECNVDIRDSPDTILITPEKSKETQKRNSLLDNLKQMGTHVIIKKKVANTVNNNFTLKQSSNNGGISRVLPIECNVDIKTVEPRIKSSEVTIVKHNGNNSIRKLGSQVLVQKVIKKVEVENYGSPDDYYDDYDMPCPIECNVDISESS